MSALMQVVDGEIEILLGDDCSTDNTRSEIMSIIYRFPEKIKYFRREKNIGGSENLRDLLRKARGDYIAHLDGDDFWFPGKLKSQINFLKTNLQCTACYTNAWVVSEDLRPMGLFNNKIKTIFDIEYLLVEGNFLNHSSLVYRGSYRAHVSKMSSQLLDYGIHLELAGKGFLGYVDSAFVAYRHGSSQSIIRSSTDQIRLLYLYALKDVFDRELASQAVRQISVANFWARIVKDAIPKSRLSWAYHWGKELQRIFPSGIYQVLFLGLIQGCVMFSLAVIRRILSKAIGVEQVRIFNRR
jgi:glycosyltransferase involved in cell wall biosynthesis